MIQIKAVHLVKANAKAKFDETVELAIHLNLDPRQADPTNPWRSGSSSWYCIAAAFSFC